MYGLPPFAFVLWISWMRWLSSPLSSLTTTHEA